LIGLPTGNFDQTLSSRTATAQYVALMFGKRPVNPSFPIPFQD
jgi:hypothetical protein